ncbi:MAG: ArdC-like ssDNA-binding domain-containing protein, partial [Sulfobacillus sp.]
MALLREALTEPGRVAECYHLFHNYSLSNALWVAGQLDARGEVLAPIASFHRWKELGRVVKKGSKALMMCMPMTVGAKAKADTTPDGTAKDDGEGERRVLFIARRNWFALHHTEPLDGAEPQDLEAPALADWNSERALSALGITREDFHSANGNCQGYALPRARRVAVSPLAAEPIKTLCHEIAHVLLHSEQGRIEDGAQLTRRVAEVEAESAAYLVCAVLCCGDLEASRGYIQHWMQDTASAEQVTEKHARR